MKSICILYGIGEGDYHGRAFVAALKSADYAVIRSARKADIIITHSGGNWFLPENYADKLVICIGPPYWPGRSLARNSLQKIVIDFDDYARDGKLFAWIMKTFWNLIHICRYLLLGLVRSKYKVRQERFYDALRHGAIIIRPRHDAFLTPNAAELLEHKLQRPVRVIEAPGQHDSCWRQPEAYIDLIRQAAK
jgi:hypothetical protein